MAPPETRRLRRLHRSIGGAALAGFAVTGFYMLWRLPGLFVPGGDPIRYLYRANHLYLLLSGLLNLAIGTYLALRDRGWRRRAQVAGSVCLLLAPAVLFPAFFLDPPGTSPQRLVTTAGMFLLFFGTLLHLPGAPRRDD
jgi:hypothetical protein